MAANHAAQSEALKDLSLAYRNARDFTREVLRKAFGTSPPLPSRCRWPPPGVADTQAHLCLVAIQDFLNEQKGEIRAVIREIKTAQDCVVASGLNMRDSWIVADPLEGFGAGLVNLCHVADVVKSAPAMHAALGKASEKISLALVKLRGKVAALPPSPAKPEQDEENGGKPKKRKARKKRSNPKDDKRVADAYVTGGYRTEADCAKALGMTVNDVHLARDRHRKRQAAKERARKKPRQ